jgi:hypothetical protein
MPLQWVSTFRLEPTCRQPLLLSPTMGSCGEVAIAAFELRCDYGQQTTSPTRDLHRHPSVPLMAAPSLRMGRMAAGRSPLARRRREAR